MEIIVNQDYKQWYLFKIAIKKIEGLKGKKILCFGDHNSYLEKYLIEHNFTYQYVNHIEELNEGEILLCLKDISIKRQKKIALLNSDNVFECYSEYRLYEEQKRPDNYIVNDFKTSDNGINYLNYVSKKDCLAKDYIDSYIKNCIITDKIKLFNKVEIETINRCNGECSFCPVNRKIDKRKFHIMEETLFKKIINELKEINYSGALALFGNNEPLLDKRLFEMAKYAKLNLPNSFLYIYTNGSLLTIPLLQKLLEVMDYIYIDNYNTSPDLISELIDIVSFLRKNTKFKSKVSIHLRNSNEIISSRAGQSPNKKEYCQVASGCILPYSQLNIKSDGRVSICSNDALGEYIMGDLSNQTLLEIWHGREFNLLRNSLIKGRIYPPCNKCDFIFTPLPFENI